MPSKLYVVLHIHKAAGSTLYRDFQMNFGADELLPMYAPEIGLDRTAGAPRMGWELKRVQDYVARRASSRTRCVFGHMAYFGIHGMLVPGAQPVYITCLRDPVERVISLYSYHRNKGTKWHAEIAQEDWTLDEWLEKSAMLWRQNGQLRQIIWGSCEDALVEPELTEEHLAMGMDMLRNFRHVALVETSSVDFPHLYGELGLRSSFPDAKVNVTACKEQPSQGTRSLIAEQNALDIKLYPYARELRAEFTRNRSQELHSRR
jgi:hypothetical protein